MCYICGRSSCTPSFHSIEEQEDYSRVEEAHQNYLDVLEEVKRELSEEE